MIFNDAFKQFVLFLIFFGLGTALSFIRSAVLFFLLKIGDDKKIKRTIFLILKYSSDCLLVIISFIILTVITINFNDGNFRYFEMFSLIAGLVFWEFINSKNKKIVENLIKKLNLKKKNRTKA